MNTLHPDEALPIINGNLEFDHNIASPTITVNFTTANRDQGIPHKLNKLGVNYLVAGQTVAGHVLRGKTSATLKTIYLQFTGVGQVTLILH